MARQDYERDDRFEDEERWARGENDREEMWRGGRRQGSGREYRDVRESGREQDWRSSSEGRSGGGQEGNEGRFGNARDREYWERNAGYGNRGWESSGMGGPSTYGSTYGAGGGYGGSMYGGSGMWGGSYGAGMTGTGWNRPMGPHFGRGPKGYRRSDERIREDVNEALFHDHYVDASELEVQVHDGDVTLSGTVDNREQKRMAEACVWNVSGVRNVSSTIRVENQPDHMQNQSMPGQRSMQGQGMGQGQGRNRPGGTSRKNK